MPPNRLVLGVCAWVGKIGGWILRWSVNESGLIWGMVLGGQGFVIVLLERLSEVIYLFIFFVLRAGAGLFPGRPVSGLADNRASALESPFCLCINTAYLLSDRAVCHLPFGGISLSSLANQAVVINLSTVQYPLCCLPVQIRPDIITVGMTPEMSCC